MEECYEVKFWFTNDEGYREQSTVQVFLVGDSKDQHSMAEKQVLNNKFFQNKNIEIVSVVYC